MSKDENQKTARYLTTTLPYVNADPHVGFALELVEADTLARYWRLMGHEVFFNTGTDEHGQKIAQKADEKGESRQAYVDHYAQEFSKLKDALSLSNDAFIRTTDEKHIKAAQAIWQKCAERGDIYKKTYTGLYCVGCELFYKENELDENHCCLIHKTPAEAVEEENYFFKLSNYQQPLIELLSDKDRTFPDWQRQWALEFVKGGLEDLSISRQKSRMDWGIPVPGDDEHVMYVWFDALTNYISTLGWPEDKDGHYQKFWVDGTSLQLAGKDQVRFQSIIFQAMLLSAGEPTTDLIVYHGFINSGGQKMSKSLGNVISPYELVEKYGTDATRYILLRHVHPTEDSDLTWEKMDEYYTANLVNGLGNLTARIMKMAETHLAGPVDIGTYNYNEGVLNDLSTYNFQSVITELWEYIGHIDALIQIEQPFKVVKEDKQKGIMLIETLVKKLSTIALDLQPFMPETSTTISAAVCANKKPDNLFNRLPE